jgi:hypothetical protein
MKTRLLEILAKTEHDSIWGVAIKCTFSGYYSSDELIRELQMQTKDCPHCMVEVIGEEAVDLLLQFDHFYPGPISSGNSGS